MNSGREKEKEEWNLREQSRESNIRGALEGTLVSTAPGSSVVTWMEGQIPIASYPAILCDVTQLPSF